MTVPSSLSKHVYSGNGVNRTWPYTFSLPESGGVADAAVLHVYRSDNGGTPYLVSSSAYTVDVDAKTVTYPLAALDPVASTVKLVLIREVDFVQETELENNGAYLAKIHEAAFDDLEYQIQELHEQSERSIKVDVANEEDTDDLVTKVLATYNRYSEIVADTNAAAASALEADTARDESVAAKSAAVVARNEALAAEAAAEKAQEATVALSNINPWSSTAVYSYPEVVCDTDGNVYRCIGTNVSGAPQPSESSLWVRQTWCIGVEVSESWIDCGTF